MKKIFTTLFAGLMISAQVMAVSVKDVCGQFNGDLNIGGDAYPSRSIYLLPGVVDSTVTFVLPDFTFGKGKLGNIVLPNIPMDANGMLHLENATLYLDSIHERASITVINGLQDEGVTYNSVISANDAMVLLSIEAPASLPEPILVLFMGEAVRANNYVLNNGGFEGGWVNDEPTGWHSFGTATGNMKDFVLDHTYQFIQSTDVRPGSKGANSAMLSSEMLLGVKANGNCTNGQINAGSTTADDASNNYNFSDPTNEGFNTPFQGHPDSLVFWAKYLPADRDAANEVNKARASVIITTNDRYQDPEGDKDYSSVVLAKAVVNYAATSDMGWQRISVPFEYTAAALENAPAYILSTFTTNMLPGGGSSYSSGTITKVSVLDTIYLDDVELVYNRELASFSRDNAELSFDKNIASVDANYCDSCAKYATEDNGISAQTFIAMDAAHKCIFVYVIADDYAQSGKYNLYRVDFTDSETEGLGPKEDETEGFESILSGEKRFKKVLFNGQFLIISNDAWYNAAGVRVR